MTDTKWHFGSLRTRLHVPPPEHTFCQDCLNTNQHFFPLFLFYVKREREREREGEKCFKARLKNLSQQDWVNLFSSFEAHSFISKSRHKKVSEMKLWSFQIKGSLVIFAFGASKAGLLGVRGAATPCWGKKSINVSFSRFEFLIYHSLLHLRV